MDYRVYLVEDEINLNKVLTYYLQKEGWQIHSFSSGEDARLKIGDRPHLWIIDIMLPGMNGYELLKEIKMDCSPIPVIFISSKNKDIEKIIGLELGSDDYLAKPFMAEELVLRTRTLLKRVYTHRKQDLTNPMTDTFVLPPYTIDREKRVVSENGNPLELTNMEYNLFHLFITYQNQILSKEQILQQVWGINNIGTFHLVDDLVYRLRRKMPCLQLKTKYSYGYSLLIKKSAKY